MSTPTFKIDLLDHIARLGKAVGHGHRLALLEYLAQGERSVDGLAKLANISVANASQHLQQLRQAGLANAHKRGLYVYYSLANNDVMALVTIMRRIAEQQSEEVNHLVHTFLTTKDNLEPIARSELLERLRDGSVTLLDVRPCDEFAAGHIQRAINIPLHELEMRLHEIPTDREVIAYCRGPYCVMAFDAVTRLRELGRNARRLQDGFPEWKLANMPIATALLNGDNVLSGA